MGKPKFDRAELERHISVFVHMGGADSDAERLARALKLTLAVLDAAVDEYKFWGCFECGANPADKQHRSDCPVKACIDAGLEKQ